MKRFMMLGLAMLLSVAMLGRAEAAPITVKIPTFGGTLLPTLNLGTTNDVVFNPDPAFPTFGFRYPWLGFSIRTSILAT